MTQPSGADPLPTGLQQRAYWIDPGRLMAGALPSSQNPGLVGAKIGELQSIGIRHIVNLMETHEVDHDGRQFNDYEPVCAKLGITVSHFPVTDGTSPSVEVIRNILVDINRALDNDRPVYVHCWGGRRRTGVVVGCWLVGQRRVAPQDAVSTIRSLRAPCADAMTPSPETTAQVHRVITWLDHDVTLNRIRGSLLGGALGDALGAVIEFDSLGSIRAKYGSGGLVDLVSGEVTDDTQMTLFTAEGLIRAERRRKDHNVHAPEIVWRAYLRWLRTQEPTLQLEEPIGSGWLLSEKWLHHRRAPGNTCLGALQSGRMGDQVSRINTSKGCGGVMRVAPCGFTRQSDESTYQLGADCAAVTHGHPSGFVPAGILAVMIRRLIAGDGLPTAVDGALTYLRARVDKADASETRAALERAVERAGAGARDVIPSELGEGWVGEEALAISVYCALVATDYRHGVTLAVNHSGDSDSTGAITGNLLGAALGVSALPAEWLNRLEGRDTIERLASDFTAAFWHNRFPDDTEVYPPN